MGPGDQSDLPSGLRVLLWGPAAVEHHKTCRSLGKSLWQQPSVGDILRLLDQDRMMKTILHFPQNRRLLPPKVREARGTAIREHSLRAGAVLPAPQGLHLHPRLECSVNSKPWFSGGWLTS